MRVLRLILENQFGEVGINWVKAGVQDDIIGANLTTLPATGDNDSPDMYVGTGTVEDGERGTLFLTAGLISALGARISEVADPEEPQDAATKAYVDAVPAMVPRLQTFVLTPTNITNGYIDLALAGITNSFTVFGLGYGPFIEGASYDYSVSLTGGVGGVTRITFLNTLVSGGGALVATDVIQVRYGTL